MSPSTANGRMRATPILIIEVLSGSTKRIDLKEKFDNYIQIPSLLEYVMVSQETPYLRVYRRRTNWQLESYYADNTLILESVDLEIAVRHIYRRVRHVNFNTHTVSLITSYPPRFP